MSALVALVVAFMGMLLFYDVSIPDDSALQITEQELCPPPVTPGLTSNPLADFVGVLKGSRAEEFYKLTPKARMLEPGTEAEARAFLATLDPPFAAFDTLLNKTNPDDWRWPEIGTEPAIRWVGPSASAINNWAMVVRLRSRLEFADGDWEKSLQSLTDLMRLGYNLQRRPGTLMHHFVGSSTQLMGESGLQAALTLQLVSMETLAPIQEMLSSSEQDRAGFRQMYRIEYRCFTETLPLLADAGDLGEYQGTQLLKPLSPYLWKRGMTSTIRLRHDQAVLASLEKSWKECLIEHTRLSEAFKLRTSSKSRRLLSPNPLGDQSHLGYTDSTKGFLERQLVSITIHRQCTLQIAMRRYELEHNELPADLATLVPHYIADIPLDPFTDLPMRWLPTTQVLYSTGSDLTDNGGTFAKPSSPKEPDCGMYYWWSPAAAKWREEERIKSLPPPPSPPGAKKTTSKPLRKLPEVAPSPESRAP